MWKLVFWIALVVGNFAAWYGLFKLYQWIGWQNTVTTFVFVCLILWVANWLWGE